MLRIVVGDEGYNEAAMEFQLLNPVVIDFEHSLVSLSKWESKHEKPFLSSTEKTQEEIFSYIVAMIVTPDIDPDILYKLNDENLDALQKYIDSNQSATTFAPSSQRGGSGEIITSELIYYWMTAFNIPFEAERWHLNRLFALIRICGIKQSKPKPMSRNEISRRNAELNAQRKAKLQTSG